MTHFHSISMSTKIESTPISWVSLFNIWVLNEMFTGLFFTAQPTKKDRTGENKAKIGFCSQRGFLAEFFSILICVGVSPGSTNTDDR